MDEKDASSLMSLLISKNILQTEVTIYPELFYFESNKDDCVKAIGWYTDVFFWNKMKELILKNNYDCYIPSKPHISLVYRKPMYDYSTQQNLYDISSNVLLDHLSNITVNMKPQKIKCFPALVDITSNDPWKWKILSGIC